MTRAGLVDAAACDDATQACLNAHNALVAALMADVAALRANEDATNADEQAAQEALNDAEDDRDVIEMAYNEATRVPPPPPPPPAHACDAGASEECVAARQMELEALDDSAPKADHDAAEQALADARQALVDHNAAEARAVLVRAAACTDGTQECLNAHDALIAALQADVTRLAGDDDATNADQDDADEALSEARTKRGEVATALGIVTRDSEIGMAVTKAETDAGKLEEDRSPDAIQTAKEAIAEARMKIADGGDDVDADAFSDDLSAADAAVARAEARNSIDAAIMAAKDAAKALTAESSVADVTAAQGLITTATNLVEGNDDHLSEAEETEYKADIDDAQAPVALAKSQNDADQNEQNMKQEEQETQNRIAMAATAKKLFDGINQQAGTVGGGFNAGDFNAFYAGTPPDSKIHVVDGVAGATEATELSEDKKATISDNHGWEGKRYIDRAGGDSYEAVVYSNVEDPEEGKKFGGPDGEYTAVTDSAPLPLDTSDPVVSGRIGSSDFDHTSGIKRFPLPENSLGQTIVGIPGTYHGVSGQYRCTPGGAVCAVQVGSDGFELGTVPTDGGAFTESTSAWVFAPGNVEARVTETADPAYSSYGWWLKKTEDGQGYTASAFHDFRSTPGATATGTAIPAAGTAKYVGGAAGKYAFSTSIPNGLNEAGHFTAKATLTATWGGSDNGEIEGTIDSFKVGDDGAGRPWIVHLHDAGITRGDGTLSEVANAHEANTTWERMEDDPNADTSGSWSGQLREPGDDGVPGAATGVFYSEYGNTGKMVGAFGATVE
ncbi:MAG: hypothetical protein OXC91_09570 [Rhodobacteraceae bacterium]|nr:hypothetical protein [Paracoccaceae bacterium]